MVDVDFAWPDDIVQLVYFYIRVFRARDTRIHLLKQSAFVGRGSPDSNGHKDFILKVGSFNASPFHNTYPFQVFRIDDMRIGMWRNDDREIYVEGEDMTDESYGRHLFPFAQSTIQSKRILFDGQWISL